MTSIIESLLKHIGLIEESSDQPYDKLFLFEAILEEITSSREFLLRKINVLKKEFNIFGETDVKTFESTESLEDETKIEKIEKKDEDEGDLLESLFNLPSEYEQNTLKQKSICDMVDFSVEPFVFSLPKDYGKGYKFEFPPKQLTNTTLNKDLKKKLDPSLFVYLRTITHPFRPHLLQRDKVYLDFLITIEGWKLEEIMYLISGTQAEKEYQYSEFNEEDEYLLEFIEEHFIKQYEAYTSSKAEFEVAEIHKKLTENETGKKVIIAQYFVELAEETLHFHFDILEHGFEDGWTIGRFYSYLDRFGFAIDPIPLNIFQNKKQR